MEKKLDELLYIINNAVPTDDGFVLEETAEVFTLEEMAKMVIDVDSLADRMGIAYLETIKRAKAKGELEEHYKEERKRDEKRAEHIQFFLGYLTGGLKKKLPHVTITYHWKQDRVQKFVPDSKIPDAYKRDKVIREIDTELLRAGCERHDEALEGIARIDTRKKASVK